MAGTIADQMSRNVVMRSIALPIILSAVLVWATALAISGAPSHAEERARLLYFTHSAGFRHNVVPASQDILKKIGATAPGFDITATEDVSVFSPESLRRFAAVMFFTTGELPMSEGEKSALTRFVGAGGGFLGVHSATDTFYLWPEYLKLIGGYFNEHPWHQKVTIEVADRSSPLVGFLPPSFSITDEIYQISDFDHGGSHVLLRLDPSSVDLTAAGVHRRFYGWPLAWTRSYGGRVFYTALGHEEAVWSDPRYQEMLHNAILWAMRRPS
jgi:type 1 glutamine amidotransferase